jgi:hypothetical protein
LLGAYFHQDWALDDPTEDDVVRRFARDEPREVVDGAAGDIARVLLEVQEESRVAALLDELRAEIDPGGSGFTARAWLSRVRALLMTAG